MSTSSIQPVSPYQEIYDQYVIESSFLWILRSHAVEQPHYTLQDLSELEYRIESHLDGLLTSVSHGWEACESALELEEPGEVFTATVVAIRSRDMTNIQKAVEVGLANDDAIIGLISAFGWLPENLATPWVERLLTGKDMKHKYLGLAAASVRRTNPGDILTSILHRDDCREDERLFSRAIRLIGELGRQDLLPVLSLAIKSDSDEVRFWAMWSAILLGNTHVSTQLEPYVLQPCAQHKRALELAFRTLPINTARQWISKMSQNDELARSVIKATGILADPHAVNWLISKMDDLSLARLAGESFSLITGLDLDEHRLSRDIPDDAREISEDSNDNLILDEDENLPWPDPRQIAGLWKAYGKNYNPGERYFMGRHVSENGLQKVLAQGSQRQRHAAAQELILLKPNNVLINTRAKL